jgi:hypothetical protein
VSDALTPRDVIARDLHQLCVDRWNQFDGASTRHGVEVHHKAADVAVAALDAAGWSLTRKSDEWEWGIHHTVEDGSFEGPFDRPVDAVDLNYIGHSDCNLARRHPAGPWELVPDVE